MSPSPRIVQVGLGPIGIEMARKALGRRSLSVVGAVDIDPKLRGRPLAEILGAACEGTVAASPEEAIRLFRPDVALVTTVSDLERVVPTCEPFLRAGVAVVSTCEEMAFPWITQPDAARRLDVAGKAGGAACLGTGINPGFVLDYLPVVATAPVESVSRIRAWRVVDAAKRRGPLQMKVGAGLTPEQFDAKVRGGGFGHRGFMESLHMICTALGIETAGATTFIKPVISAKAVKTDFVQVQPGQVAGIHQGAEDREGRVVLDLKMYAGADDPGDSLEIEGVPTIRLKVEGGYHGDIATCAISLNAIPAVRAAAPGLRTMLDVRAIHASLGS